MWWCWARQVGPEQTGSAERDGARTLRLHRPGRPPLPLHRRGEPHQGRVQNPTRCASLHGLLVSFIQFSVLPVCLLATLW